MQANEIKANEFNSYIILDKLEIDGHVCGEFVEFQFNYIYENKGGNDLDAVYELKVPSIAVISGIHINLGGSHIIGKIQSKKEVKNFYINKSLQYNEKLQIDEMGHNHIRVTIKNMLSGEKVEIKISYIEELEYYRNKLKLIVPKITNPLISSNINLCDNNKYNYKVDLNILIETFEKAYISCKTHSIIVENENENLYKVKLKDSFCNLDEDMIIFIEETSCIEAGGIVYEDYENNNGILYLRLYPNIGESFKVKKFNYIFLLDNSSSMKDNKIEKAKKTLKLSIGYLNPGDMFNIASIGGSVSLFSNNGLLEFNNVNLLKAYKWIDGLSCENNCNALEGIKYAFENEAENKDNVILVFTDGRVENEKEILDYIQKIKAKSRIFLFGIDALVNGYFINEIIKLTNGKAEFINSGKIIEEKVLRQFKRIKSLKINNVNIDWGAMNIEKTYPRSIDYLYDSERFSIFAKYSGELEDMITVKGKVKNKLFQRRISLKKLTLDSSMNLIEKVWYKKRIESLEERIIYEKNDTYELMFNKIIDISSKGGILSDKTSFILIEEIYDPILGGIVRRLIPANTNMD